MTTSKAQYLLDQLRKAFLQELPFRCDELEQLVLTLNGEESFRELYRRVHSLKGSGATLGVGIVSTICHDFEDQLNLYEPGNETRMVDILLKFVDLIRQSTQIVMQEEPDFSEVEAKLATLRNSTLRDLSPGLLVESSRYMAMLCMEALSELPVRLTIVEDSLTGLDRLLNTKYDFLITSNEARVLNGFALISAVHVSDSLNKNIMSVLLTASREQGPAGSVKPDYVIKKTPQLGDDLKRAVADILARESHQ